MRFVGLEKVPYGLSTDETLGGLHVACLAQTGVGRRTTLAAVRDRGLPVGPPPFSELVSVSSLHQRLCAAVVEGDTSSDQADAVTLAEDVPERGGRDA